MYPKITVTSLTALLLAALVSAFGTSGDKVRGIISSRTGETLIVSSREGDTTVVLSDRQAFSGESNSATSDC